MRSFKGSMLIALVTVIFFALPSSASIRAAQPPTCDPAPLYTKATELKSSGDAKKDAASLAEFADEIQQMNILCNGYRFEGKGGQAIGPLDLPTGTWLVTITIKGNAILNTKVLSGDCQSTGFTLADRPLLSVTAAEAADGASVVLDSKDCRLLLTAQLIEAPYVLTFEPVS